MGGELGLRMYIEWERKGACSGYSGSAQALLRLAHPRLKLKQQFLTSVY